MQPEFVWENACLPSRRFRVRLPVAAPLWDPCLPRAACAQHVGVKHLQEPTTHGVWCEGGNARGHCPLRKGQGGSTPLDSAISPLVCRCPTAPGQVRLGARLLQCLQARRDTGPPFLGQGESEVPRVIVAVQYSCDGPIHALKASTVMCSARIRENRAQVPIGAP